MWGVLQKCTGIPAGTEWAEAHDDYIRKTYILLYHAFSCFFVLLVLFEGKKVTL